jgi:D-beta-D-heptose 7-phosphate kinase/D-beta-D-heptose 1-phosphate adenosyltransferase
MSKKKKKVVAVSGGFDPIHIGHVRMLQDARKIGNVIVFLNTDNWLKRKKGYVFMPWQERAEILLAIRGVKEVYSAMDDDNTVCEALKFYKPDVFANGGDRKPGLVPEYQVCEELGIEMAFSVGGDDKPQSSSWLVEKSKYAKLDHGDGIVF